MEIENIKELSDEELGMELAFAVGWFVGTGQNGLEYGKERTEKCEPKGEYFPTEALCTDLNVIHEVEKIVIDRVGLHVYGEQLNTVIWETLDSESKSNTKLRGNWVGYIATVLARQKAEALLFCLSNQEKK